MSDRMQYKLKCPSPGVSVVCGSIASGTDGYTLLGSGFTSVTHAGSTLVVNHDKYRALIAGTVNVVDPDTASTQTAYISSAAPTDGTTTIQCQSAAGTAADIINHGPTGVRVDFVLYFRNTDLTV
jgi:hypothetical protein